jgi:hypothetical protein
VSQTYPSTEAEALKALFCSHCALIEQRRSNKCPKGQTTCGAQIETLYTLKRSYAGIPAGSVVGIKDIFWSVAQDYATVTIVTAQKQRYGVACTLLEENTQAGS